MLQGHVESDEIFIDQPIGHLAESEHRMCVEPTNGKVAQTHLTVLKRGYYFGKIIKHLLFFSFYFDLIIFFKKKQNKKQKNH